MKDNILKTKTFNFALRIFKLSQHLQVKQKEYVLSKQLLKSGTSVGAMIREAEHSESKIDFIHKLAVAQKEINETIYWLELLHASNMLTLKEFESIQPQAIEIIKLITSSIKTAKNTTTNH